jgi:glyoxylase-like metal-dependent hydrolase (beta-lactamase superfamily II)
MAEGWTRRQVLAQASIAAAVYTLDPHELCCTISAHAQTADRELFELKKVGDGVWGAVAATRYKVNCNAAVIETNDGVVVVDSHSKPSAAAALYKEIQGLTKKPVRKLINTHFHWDHWQGNEAYARSSPGLEIIASERTKENLSKPDAGVGGVPYIEKQIAALPAEIAKLKDDVQKAPNAETKARLESNLAQA